MGKRFDLTMVDASVLPEASTLRSIKHDNVVEVKGAARVDGYDPLMDVIEIITPHYPRGSITDALLRGEEFTTREAIVIMTSALRGLRELHMRHNILHRDIKSGNILLTSPPIYALVADIGVAGTLDSNGSAPAVNNPTLYSPPELMTAGVLTMSSDLYSMGLVMRELLGGAFPYGAYSRQQVVEELAAGRSAIRPVDLELPVWAPTNLRKLYRKATAGSPARRFQNAKDMGHAISRLSLANWTTAETNTWEAAGIGRNPPRYRVEATVADQGYVISLRKATGARWRRPQHQNDVLVDSLHARETQRIFDAANAMAVS